LSVSLYPADDKPGQDGQKREEPNFPSHRSKIKETLQFAGETPLPVKDCGYWRRGEGVEPSAAKKPHKIKGDCEATGEKSESQTDSFLTLF
jgi:hypothetical protein